MKKALLFFAMISLFALALAFSVSAKTVISQDNIAPDGDIVACTEYHVKDYQYYLSVSITYDDVNGNTKQGKIYYLTDPGLYRNMLQIMGVYVPSDFDFNQMIYLFDKVDLDGNGEFGSDEYLKGSNGATNVMHWHTYESFNSSTGKFSSATVDAKANVTAISYSKYMVYFGGYFIPCAKNLKTVTYNGKEPVDGTVFISATVNEVMACTFGGDGSSTNDVNKTPRYTRLVFDERTTEISLGQYAFCRGVLEEVVFLGGNYNLRSDGIAYQFYTGTNTSSLKRIVVASGTTLTSGSIALQIGSYDIVFIGTPDEYSAQSAEGKFTSLRNATGNVTYETICYVNGHTDSNDYDCTTDDICAVQNCSHVVRKGNEAHSEITNLEYADLYSTAIEATTCQNGDCNHRSEKELAPIFEFLGYSVKQNDANALCAGLVVNRYAIDTYGIELSYGIVSVVYEENEAKIDLFNQNGELSVGSKPAICVDLSSASSSAVDFRLLSGSWDEYADLELVMAMYVYDGNGQGVEYVNCAEEARNSYEIITYNGIASK